MASDGLPHCMQVRDALHGLLVLRMERMHKGRPDLVEPEMDVPPGWA